ncbi:MAG: PDZ domain-containing protein [Gemmataceae bacterium]
MRFWSLALMILPLVLALAPADEAKPGKRVYRIPYKLTIPKHIVVRAKVNGKGPFNLILDTGAPALILATKAAKKAGVEPNSQGWATLDRLDIEGGLRMPPTLARIETPFQLEGMNGMGLAGLEIHGLLGYQALATFRMEIDFTSDRMVWTELDYKPSKILGLGAKGGGQGGLETFGSLMGSLGKLLGRRPMPEIALRGFHGMTLADGDEHPRVTAVLAKGPAGTAGLRTGDVLTKFNGRTVTNIADVLRFSRAVAPGKPVTLTVQRGDAAQEISFTTGEGI